MKKFFKGLILLILCTILSLDLVIYHMKEISKSYMSEKKIYELISSISISDFLVDDNGEELKEIKRIKEELTNVGFPTEAMDSLLDTEAIEKEVSKGIAKSLEIVLTGKGEEMFSFISSDAILNFAEENVSTVSKELQKNNVPGSNLLTEERQQEIIIKMEEIAPRIEEQVNGVIETVKEKFEDTEQYKNFVKIKNAIEQVSKITTFLYSGSFNALLISIAIGCTLLIVLISHSKYSYLKFLGISCLINAVLFWGTRFAIVKVEAYTKEVPAMLQGFLETLFKGLENSFQSLFIIYLILFILLILLNIIIHKLIEGKVDKKLNEI